MARVLDLSTDDDGVLHRTDASGLFSSGHLAAAPLASHLSEDETPRYLLDNKKAGVTVTEGDAETLYEPGADYRAFAIVTDQRVLFVAGRAEGDETLAVPLAAVYNVGTESAGLLSRALVVETADGRRFSFPCRGDLDPVVETLRARAGTDDGATVNGAPTALDDDGDETDGDETDGGRDGGRDEDHEASAAAVADAVDGVDVAAGDADADSSDADAPPAGVADADGAAADEAAVDPATLCDALRDRSRAALTEVVAEIWSARGWTTTPFEAGDEAVYDLLAVCPDSESRLLLWITHHPEGGAIDETVLDRIAATRERTSESVRATVVTTGTVPAAVRDRAAAEDVAVVDCEGLCDLLVATDLADSVGEKSH